MKILPVLVTLVLLAACSTTDNQSAANAAADKEKKMAEEVLANATSVDKKDEKTVYCTSEPMIGTRLPKRRVCKTKEQWRIISEASKETVNEIQRMNIPVLSE
ncbi:MAG: hypothetical protein WD002_00995 [Pseudomonadales bacterium]